MANYFWSECSDPNTGCGGVNLSGSGDPATSNGYRQDYSVPLKRGTPVQSPVNGVILPEHHSGYLSLLGRQKWGGETDILTMLPEYSSKPVVLTILHYDTIDANVQGGAVVKYGDVLGTSGGQTSGGNWPSDPKDSTGPHVGVAVRPYNSWHGYWDPTFFMNELLGGANPSSVPSADQLNAFGIKTHTYVPGGQARIDKPSFSNPLDAIGAIFAFISDPDHWVRLAKIVAGGFLIAIGIVATIFGPALPDIAAAGVTAAGIPEAAGPVQQTLGGRGRRRTLRAGIRTAGAIQGQKTLARRKEEGERAAEERQSEKQRKRGRQSAETRAADKAAGRPPRTIRNPARQAYEQAQAAPPGEPVYAPGTRGTRHLIGYRQSSGEITKEPRVLAPGTPPRKQTEREKRQTQQQIDRGIRSRGRAQATDASALSEQIRNAPSEEAERRLKELEEYNKRMRGE